MRTIPCKCGHLKDQHRKGNYFWYARCLECIRICPSNRTENLHEYRHDNLKYLEQIYETKFIDYLHK